MPNAVADMQHGAADASPDPAMASASATNSEGRRTTDLQAHPRSLRRNAPPRHRAARPPPGVTLVSREGRLLSRHALVHYAPDSRTHGVIERQREIDQLAADVERAQEAAALAHEAVAEAEAVAAQVQDSLSGLRRDAQALQARVHSEQVEVLKLNQARMRFEERCGELYKQQSLPMDFLLCAA